MRVLFLDDDTERQRRFKANSIGTDLVQVWTFDEAKAALEGDRFDQIFLDHDLSDYAAAGIPREGEKTGLDVACLVAALPEEKRPRLVIIHSFNPDGARRMHAVLKEAGVCRVFREPFNANRTCPQAEGSLR